MHHSQLRRRLHKSLHTAVHRSDCRSGREYRAQVDSKKRQSTDVSWKQQPDVINEISNSREMEVRLQPFLCTIVDECITPRFANVSKARTAVHRSDCRSGCEHRAQVESFYSAMQAAITGHCAGVRTLESVANTHPQPAFGYISLLHRLDNIRQQLTGL
jgi:hypothetical protein